MAQICSELFRTVPKYPRILPGATESSEVAKSGRNRFVTERGPSKKPEKLSDRHDPYRFRKGCGIRLKSEEIGGVVSDGWDMSYFNEESKRDTDSQELRGKPGWLAEPKPKARPKGTEPEPPDMRPHDALLGFVVRPEEMGWIEGLLSDLTPRQRDVLMECCSGGNGTEIAARMGMSQSTLQNHLHAMRHKLGVTGRDGMSRLVSVRLLRAYRTRMAHGSS